MPRRFLLSSCSTSADPETGAAIRAGHHYAARKEAALGVALSMWLVCGQPAFAAGADTDPGVFQRDAEPIRRIRYSPHLIANNSNTERYVISGTCEQQGIRAIAQILRRFDFEEMWAFLPRAHPTEKCEWHEIGREEKSEKDSAYLRVDMQYLEGLMSETTEIHIVHFHPLRYFECAADAGCPRKMAAGRSAPIDRRWITDLVFSMPSPSDVHFMMDVTSRFNERHQGRGTIRHKVVTPYGVVDYGLTEKGLAKFDAEKYSRSEGLYITWVLASGLADDRLEAVLKGHPDSLLTAVRRLAQTLNTENLRVVHRPLVRDPNPTTQSEVRSITRPAFSN